MTVPRSLRAKTTIEYHSRRGQPILHWTQEKRPYIMVRARGGGVKRLYLDTEKAKKQIKKGRYKLLLESKEAAKKVFPRRQKRGKC